jgi:hypothetical protein
MATKRRKAAKPALSAIADTPKTVQVRVVRAYVGSPPLGSVIEVTMTDHLKRLIRAGFMKVEAGR